MAAGCLSGGQQTFKNMDAETGDGVRDFEGLQSPGRRGRTRLGVILATVSLVVCLTAFALSIYAAVKVGQLSNNQSAPSSGSFITPTASGVYQIQSPNGSMDGALLGSSANTVPTGYQFGGHLFQGTGYFARLTPMMYARSDHRTKPVGDDVYIIGGQTNLEDLLVGEGATNATASEANTAVLLDRMVRYSTYTEHSFELARMPLPRSRHAAVVLGDDIYVIGGVNNQSDNPPRPLPTDMYKYSISNNTWTVLPGPSSPRSDVCADTADGKIYVFGGYDGEYNNVTTSDVFDPATGVWSAAADMPTSRGDCEVSVVSDECVLVLGGSWANETTSGFLATAECYNPKTNSWSTRTGMSQARGDFAAEALDGGRVIVMGGEYNDGVPGYNEYANHDVEVYIESDDVWVPKAQLAQARFRFDTAHVGERVYVFGGQPTCSDTGLNGRQPCVAVALDTVWTYYDINYPNVYVYTKAT